MRIADKLIQNIREVHMDGVECESMVIRLTGAECTQHMHETVSDRWWQQELEQRNTFAGIPIMLLR